MGTYFLIRRTRQGQAQQLGHTCAIVADKYRRQWPSESPGETTAAGQSFEVVAAAVAVLKEVGDEVRHP